MLSADQVAQRFCELQAKVSTRVTGFDTAADCFCGHGGFWGCDGYGGTFEEGYRNEGEALRFIERCVDVVMADSDLLEQALARHGGE